MTVALNWEYQLRQELEDTLYDLENWDGSAEALETLKENIRRCLAKTEKQQ